MGDATDREATQPAAALAAAAQPPAPPDAHLRGLNRAQRCAVEFGIDPGSAALPPPLLIIAGAGSGKTRTLVHRVAHLIHCGADPRRILLLTFSRRAAYEMRRRTQRILAARRGRSVEIRWAGTFHAIANRLLRLHGIGIGLDPAFTVLDRSDAADLIDLERDALGLAARSQRFPRKSTCLSIYSHTVNAQCPIEQTLKRSFPWCERWGEELRQLFGNYADAKRRLSVLDYDDLLLYWQIQMSEPELAREVRQHFDHVLVDEYQDTNSLQASILLGLKPDGRGLTVVGDDAQSIYGFRAATVRNILDFPDQFEPAAEVVTLEQNYRATQPLLEACNALMLQARERFSVELFSERASAERPELVHVESESAQVEYLVERVLEHREAGVALNRQAVLMRTAHHSDALEVELGRRGIPFVKYGGLKFLEAAHVKDLLCILRWAENPRDEVAGFRVMQLLPGIGPGHARRAAQHLAEARWEFSALELYAPPAAAAVDWPPLCALLVTLRESAADWSGQLGRARSWYQPHLERLYDAAHVRAADLEQLEQIAAGYPTRERFLSELTLDPPEVTADEAGVPLLDEDYLILSTIHSAKGQEWDVVYVLNVVDGCIPSDMATGRPEEIEEERRLLYVAMTRARDHLHLIQPLRFYKRQQRRGGDSHVYAPRSRFLSDGVLACLEPRNGPSDALADRAPGARAVKRIDAAAMVRDRWR